MGLGKGSSATTEMGMLDSMSPVDLLKLRTELENKKVYTPEEAKANQQQTLIDLGYSTPVLSNAMSLTEAIHDRDAADRLAGEGDAEGASRARARAIANTASAFLPSLGGLGGAVEGAGSRAGIFVPVGEGKADMARSIYKNAPKSYGRLLEGEGGGDVLPRSEVANRGLHKTTGMFFGPEGIPKHEISDAGMRMTGKAIDAAPGTVMPLGDVMEHPALFADQPWLADIPVNMTAERNASGRPIARMTPDNAGMEFTVRGRKGLDKQMEALLKLSQYAISDKAGFAAASRDGLPHRLADIDRTVAAVEDGLKSGRLTSEAVGDYLGNLHDVQDEIRAAMTGEPAISRILRGAGYDSSRRPSNSDIKTAVRDWLGTRIAGNDEVNRVKGRFAAGSPKNFPYDVGSFSDMVVLPKAGLDDAALSDFLGAWNEFGQGRALAGKR